MTSKRPHAIVFDYNLLYNQIMEKSRDPQLKISLSKEIYQELQEKATGMGMTMAAYVRVLLVNDLLGREVAKGGGVVGEKTVIEVVSKCEVPEAKPEGKSTSRQSGRLRAKTRRQLPPKTVRVADIFKYI